MNKILISLAIILCTGCKVLPKQKPTAVVVENNKPVIQIKHTGPVTVIDARYLLHQTLARPDKSQFEFFHCDPQGGALLDEGTVIDIWYTGDYNKITLDDSCAKIESVFVIKKAPVSMPGITIQGSTV
jgi:hypothetical protein